MRGTLLAAIFLLALMPAAQAEPYGVRFHDRAQAGPAVAASGVEWMLIVFHAPESSFQLDWPSGGAGWNLTRDTAGVRYLDGKGVDRALPEAEGWPSYGPVRMRLDFASADWASLYLEGEGLGVAADAVAGTLQGNPDGRCMGASMSFDETSALLARHEDLCPAGDSAMVELRPAPGNQTLPIRLDAARIRVAEWHNAAATCLDAETACPAGGVRRWQESQTPANAANATLVSQRFVYERLTGHGPGTALGAGQAAIVLAGGGSLDLSVRGSIRLPLAEGEEPCEGCTAPDGRTLQAEGDLRLEGFRMSPDGSLSGSLDGAASAVRFDESFIDPALLFRGGAAVAGAVGLAALLLGLKPLAALLTRFTRQGALRHPKRRLLNGYVQANPGVSFRELCRGTDLATGTARPHLNVLKRSGLVSEHRHGRTLRFFPSGVPATPAAILLREEPLRRLHAWIEGNPWSTQAQAIAQAASWGWGKGTARHRLRRLAKAGLVVVQGPNGSRRVGTAEAAAHGTFPQAGAVSGAA